MAELLAADSLIALVTLAALEIVLGVDNLVFIAILSNKLPAAQQATARRVGLLLAAVGRIVLLFAISWLITLDEFHLLTIPWFGEGAEGVAHAGGESAAATGAAHAEEGHATSGIPIDAKGLILILGGLFLMGKATWEIHANLEGAGGHHGEGSGTTKKVATFGSVIAQILLLDLVFSIDSVLTAVGMVKPDEYTSPSFPFTSIPWPPLVIMATGVILAIVVMLSFAGPLSRFVQNHPTMKMLALAFLLLIGVVLVAEGFHVEIPRGYIYFAMGFSIFVALINLKLVQRREHPERATATAPDHPSTQHPLPEGSVDI